MKPRLEVSVSAASAARAERDNVRDFAGTTATTDFTDVRERSLHLQKLLFPMDVHKLGRNAKIDLEYSDQVENGMVLSTKSNLLVASSSSTTITGSGSCMGGRSEGVFQRTHI